VHFEVISARLAHIAVPVAGEQPEQYRRTRLDIDLVPEAEPRRVVANFLRYPDIVATADGQAVPVAEDDWQRIVVEVPAGIRAVQIRYRPPWGAALLLALLPAAAGVVAVFACRRGTISQAG